MKAIINKSYYFPLLVCLIAALACNYPGAAWQSGDVSGEALRQTLAAQGEAPGTPLASQASITPGEATQPVAPPLSTPGNEDLIPAAPATRCWP